MTIATVPSNRSSRAKLDSVLAQAIDLARGAALEEADHAQDVGEHAGVWMLGDRFAMHKFACTMRGYVGWHWSVTLARAPRSRVATVCEVALLPSEESILAPQWLPWSQRLRPGDIGPGDVLPFRADDPRLEPGYTATGNEEEDQVAIEELALARMRVLSPQGREETAKRWYEGANGPRSQGSLQAAASCGSCGFLVKLQGSLGQVFGVCTNVWSDDDGKVVALGHGCGAHSETDVPHRATDWPENHPIIDETSIEQVTSGDLDAVELPTDADRAGARAAHDAGNVDHADSAEPSDTQDLGLLEGAGTTGSVSLEGAAKHHGFDHDGERGAVGDGGQPADESVAHGTHNDQPLSEPLSEPRGGSKAEAAGAAVRPVLDVISELRAKSREQARVEREEQRAEIMARSEIAKTLDSIAASIGKAPEGSHRADRTERAEQAEHTTHGTKSPEGAAQSEE